MKFISALLGLALCIVLYLPAIGNPVLVDTNEQLYNFGSECVAFVDSSGSLSAEEVMARDAFVDVLNDAPNFGISHNSVWLKFQVSSKVEFPCLRVAYPTLDILRLYRVQGDSIQLVREQGEALPFNNREYEMPAFIFDLNLNKCEDATFLLEVVSRDQILLPVTLGAREKLLESQSDNYILFGLYFGIILVMFFYNLFIYISTKDKSYFWYVIHTGVVGLTQASFQGYSYQFLWPNSPWWANQSTLVLTCAVSIVGIFFFKEFVRSKEFIPKLDKVFSGVVIAYVLLAAIGMFVDYSLAYQILQPVQSVVALSILGAAIYIARKGYRPAQFYLMAWSVLMLGIIIFALKDFGVLPYNTFTTYTMQAGSALEVILLSIALADKINTFKKEKEDSQQKTLEALKENERIIREQNVILESKVRERTVELEQSNTELNDTLSELQQTQAQLVDAEKMASLGQMTAGIAHELNNPINFVSSNISPLKRDIEDLFEVLDKYDNLKDGENIKVKLDEIAELKKDLEVDFIRTEIDQLLKGINEGAVRTSEIVKGLRVFSRLDEDTLKKASVNECLESTLVIIKSNWKGACQLEVDFDDSVPAMNCFPGKLNQVFMNILNNAGHATEQTGRTPSERLVKVSTSAGNGHVQISIKDNGVGISEEVKPRIFDPFFTTKEVGEGTGLGLSIVLGIINDHKGKIDVNTVMDEGTEFLITLPMNL